MRTRQLRRFKKLLHPPRQNLYLQDSKDYGADFSNLVIYRYNQKQAENVVRQCDEWLDDEKPDYQKYIHLKKEAKSKMCLLHDLRAEQKHTLKFLQSKRRM